MNTRPTYSEAALARIQKAGETALGKFISEIPRRTLRAAVRRLFPAPRGFRPTSEAAVEHQVRQFVYAVAKRKSEGNFDGTREEKSLYTLWRTWALSNIPGDMLIRELFEDLDRNEDESEADKLERFKNGLGDLAKAGACARETLERFIEFSPFGDIAMLRTAIKKAPTLSEIEQEAKLRELPRRLENDELRLRSLDERLRAAEHDLTSILDELGEIRQVLSGLEKEQPQMHNAIKQMTGEWARNIEMIVESQQAELSATTQMVTDRLRSWSATLETVSNDQRKIAEQTQHKMRQLDDLYQQVEGHELKLDELAEAVVRPATPQSAGGVDKSAPLPGRVEWLTPDKQLINKLGLTRVKGSITDDIVTPIQLSSFADLVSSVKDALVGCGLKASMASTFAEELIGTAASEQIIFLKGSLAVEVARACALSISDSFAYRLLVPVGADDFTQLQNCLALPPNAEGILPSLVIEGINASPLESVRETLLDQVVQRSGSTAREHPIIVFATLSDSSGCFPLDPSYLELGPIFDLEHMRWNRRKRAEIPLGAVISVEAWLSLRLPSADAAIDSDETMAWCRKFLVRRNARFESSVLQASISLTSLRQRGGTTILQSLTFGWLMPLWQMMYVKADDIAALIDDGKCDDVDADERLVAALKEYRARVEA